MRITKKSYKNKGEIVTELFLKKKSKKKENVEKKRSQNMSEEDKLKLKEYGKGIAMQEK